MELKVYTARRDQSFLKLFAEILRGFKEGRQLAWRLFIRDLKAGYKKSFLGFVWILLPPLATAFVWILLSSQKVIAIQDTPMAYKAFTICGTVLWSLFAESIVKPLNRFHSSMGMMGKLNFPREAIILAALYDITFSFLLRVIVLVTILAVIGYQPTWNFIPAFLCIYGLALSGLVIGVFLSPLGLLYSDVAKGLTLFLPFAMYLTPVIYPMKTAGYLSTLQWLNPVTPFLERARSLLGNYAFTMQSELTIWPVVLLLLMIIGLISIKIALPIIIERSGS